MPRFEMFSFALLQVGIFIGVECLKEGGINLSRLMGRLLEEAKSSLEDLLYIVVLFQFSKCIFFRCAGADGKSNVT